MVGMISTEFFKVSQSTRIELLGKDMKHVEYLRPKYLNYSSSFLFASQFYCAANSLKMNFNPINPSVRFWKKNYKDSKTKINVYGHLLTTQ